jgi:Glycoside hydrolase family 44
VRSHPGLLALLLLAVPAVASAAPLTVYDDQLRNGFADWSWATHNLSQTSIVHTGTAAVSFEPDSWQALFLHRDLGIDTTAYSAVDFWIHGGPSGGQSLTVALTVGGSPVGQSAALGPFIAGGTVPAGQWAKVHVPFASLGVTSGAFDGFWLQDATGGNQSAVYVDDFQLLENTAPPPPPGPVAVSVDPGADRHAISPLIYGVNFGSKAQAARLHWPVRRWGGNTTTRYSWQDDISNHASDWFFYNIEESTPNPATLPDGSTADVFIDDTRAAGGEPLMTVPTIGWTPKDRVRRWSFSVAKYGAQQQTECTATGNASWCQPDAGNGLHTNGTPITGNDPHDTSKEIGPDFITGWLTHIAGRTGTAGQGGVRLFELDNEPALWNSTHRDVHPNPLTYDELWQRTAAYAAALKAQDPNVRILGPSDWGWCVYFFSAADGCSAGADAAAHGNLALYDWYLQQVKNYQTAHGVRLIDYLDFHFYPQGDGISLSDDESAATSAKRLRSLKGLYDPNYVDESWINQTVWIIPRMKQWIANRLPGVGLAITEYNWGNDNGASSTLAQAEALAIFGREGVDLATRWVAPADNSKMEDAFLLYLNYDGQGSRVSGDSVRAVSADVDAVGAYAVRGAGSRLFVLLFNKDTADREADVQLPAGTLTGTPAALYRFDAAHRLAAAGTVSPAGDLLKVVLPARSATLAVVDVGQPAAADFYTLPPCRLIDTRNAAGPLGGPALAAGTPRSFDLAGQCGIPATARAVSVNVTVVSPSAAGYVVAYAGGGTAPVASLVNFASGQTRANNAIVPVSQDGKSTLAARAALTSGTVQLVVDVNGYFQ